MAKGKGTPTEAQKAKKTRQPINTETNRKRKLAKHVKRHPNDQQAVQGKAYERPTVLHDLSTTSGRKSSSSSELQPQQARPVRFKQVNEEHLGLVRISAATLLKLHEYKNILLGQKQTLAEASQEFSTDPLK